MTMPARPFLQSDTHGIVLRPENRIYRTSGDLGWSSVFVSEQREQPFAAEVPAAGAHLIVLHLGGPVVVRGAVQGHDVRKAVRPGGLFLWPAGSGFKIELEAAVDTLHLYLHDDVVDEVASSLGCAGPGARLEPILGGSDPLIEQLALEVSAAARTGGMSASLHVDQLALSIAGRLVRKNGGDRQAETTRHGFGRHRLRVVTDYVEDALEMGLSLKDLSNLAAMSVTHFTRQFRAEMGMSPHQYVVRRRIERAKYLLGYTQEPIAQIAHGCGFSHQEHLSGMFRRHVGETPARYRRRKRGAATR
ncbi:helix-turn-helix domain-containing protein [Sphingobium baderi]|uniref:HTH araC/xylS-type domain-containing protein n=1 Tax=Sphingobium baderi LL03 TaxID=1114964 RepID=T0I1V1_9SPHN|nr:helix-turn-helix domain-containing protein [Sphingobium baderi]EQB05645.1 hypothetical protein L485_02685 [Sphingobium baderi LL03]KMS52263.1 hypothetical protein V475_22200 [Sphingobium baderi LL03]